MGARRLSSNAFEPDAAVVAEAAAALAAGQLIVMPTETVYGLACRTDDEGALQRLFDVKRRSPQKALAILLAEPEAIAFIAEFTGAARQLAAAFMPGPLTLVLRKKIGLSSLVTGGRDTVGVRVPDLPLTRAILAACKYPVVATSANLSGEPPAISADALPAELVATVDLIIDGSPCPGGQPSTVVDLTGNEPIILRPGPISEEQIRRALEHCREDTRVRGEEEK